MKIGLDYGGVISFAPDGWAKSIQKARERGHEFYLISHCGPGEMTERQAFVEYAGMINLSFDDLDYPHHQKEIAERKAQLCQEHGVEIFIDDDLHRVEAVGRMCDRCAALYIPQNLWQVGQRLIDGLGSDW